MWKRRRVSDPSPICRPWCSGARYQTLSVQIQTSTVLRTWRSILFDFLVLVGPREGKGHVKEFGGYCRSSWRQSFKIWSFLKIIIIKMFYQHCLTKCNLVGLKDFNRDSSFNRCNCHKLLIHLPQSRTAFYLFFFCGVGVTMLSPCFFFVAAFATCETNLLFLKMVAINLSNDLARLNEKKKRMLGK